MPFVEAVVVVVRSVFIHYVKARKSLDFWLAGWLAVSGNDENDGPSPMELLAYSVVVGV